MSIVVIGTVFVDIKGFPEDLYIPTGRNVGTVETFHGGVGRNVAEDIANVQLNPILLTLVDDTATGEEVLRKLRGDALLKLAAPMLGTTYDSLKQRHRTRLFQQLAAAAHEGLALQIFVFAGRLSHEQHFGVRIPHAEHHVSARFVQRAVFAGAAGGF